MTVGTVEAATITAELGTATLQGSVYAMAVLADIDVGSPVIEEITLPFYEGSYEIVPGIGDTTLDTANRSMAQDVTVKAIPYYTTTNKSGGYTAIIGDGN